MNDQVKGSIAGGDSINNWNRNTYNGGEKEKTTLFGGGVRVLWWSVSDLIQDARIVVFTSLSDVTPYQWCMKWQIL